jgi:tetratricopeptide (TPR) repeat protein/uncharacterized protein YhhL (DUF1145 family)
MIKPATGEWSWRLGLVAGLGAAACVVYAPAIDGGLIWDDVQVFVTENPLNRDLAGLVAIWTSFKAVDYWPLAYSAFWVEWRLWGEHPRGYHLVNLGLHVQAAILLALLLRRLAVRGWWLAALLFVVHPVNVEAVAWISQQKTLLATTLMFASGLLYLRARQGARASDGVQFLASGVFALAMLAKTSVVAFPVALLGYEALDRGINRSTLMRLLPFFLVAIAGGALTLACNAAHDTGAVHDRGLAERVAGMGAAAWFYAYKAVWPTNLCFVYPRWDIDPWRASDWLPSLAWLAVLTAAWSAVSRSWGRATLAGLGWYLLMLAPASGIVDIYFLSYAPVADHYQYPALPGLLALISHALAGAARRATAWLEGRWPRSSILVGRLAGGAIAMGVAGVVITLAGAARGRAAVFIDAETLWRETLRRNPTSDLAYNNLGALLRDRGDNAGALACYREVMRLPADSAAAAMAETNFRGLTALRAFEAGDLPQASAELDLLLAAPHFPHRHLVPEAVAAVLNLRGKVAALLEDDETAGRMFAASLEALPTENTEAVAFLQFTQTRGAFGDDDRRLYPALSQVVGRFPGTLAAARAHHLAGLIASRQGDAALAVRHFQSALVIAPQSRDSRAAHDEARAEIGTHGRASQNPRGE